MAVKWTVKHFNELTAEEIYQVLRLRISVFIVEQNCPYQEADGKDMKSFHVMGSSESGELLAYARVLPAGLAFDEVSIGRVVSSQNARGTGAGKELMKNAIEFIKQQFGAVPVRIGAQCYLKKFYSGFGFEIVSEEYIEDNIPHVEMLLS